MKKGAYLLVALLLVACSASQQQMLLTVENPSTFDRQDEIVEMPWTVVKQRFSFTDNSMITVIDNSGQQLPFQLVTNGTDSVQAIIFPVSLNGLEKKTYRIRMGEPHGFSPMVYGRLVPERKDDFAWENNRVAFRVYGPALQATGEISNGMDFWAKKTDSLIIDKWYKNDLSGVASYHQDHGEGLDFYKVGRTLGLGMTAPFYADSLCLGKNFTSAEVLDNGPLRITFKLGYDSYKAGEKTVSETRVISLDAYNQLNKVISVFEADTTELTLATGIVTLKDTPEVVYGDNSGIIAYEVPTDSLNGTIFTGVINPKGFGSIKSSYGHYIGFNSYVPGTEYTYYSGGGWSKSGFADFDEWTNYLKKQKEKIDNPLKITVE
ncbi:MAG TPA: DUF4861 domain-containing protein [Petrimonas sp.]|uniref:DUF4861 family protein n=1 Tax=Petrimonas sp. TaxID=2023866 RepID=UPI00176A575E|nr:DUF4861 domain-containing protein [Petrimonas sp.]